MHYYYDLLVKFETRYCTICAIPTLKKNFATSKKRNVSKPLNVITFDWNSDVVQIFVSLMRNFG